MADCIPLTLKGSGKVCCQCCQREIDGSQCGKPCREFKKQRTAGSGILTEQEIAKLFGDADQTLLGNQIASLLKNLGIPPCDGCNSRKRWLNAAHAWLRGDKKQGCDI